MQNSAQYADLTVGCRSRMVAEINGIANELDLHRHLFGIRPDHAACPLRDSIAALQNNRCFYCFHPLGSTAEADH